MQHKGGHVQMGMIADWPSMAACRNGDPDALFVQGAEQNVAKRICRGCPVRYECLADALDNRIEFGVWGGMTERERRALLRLSSASARHSYRTGQPRQIRLATFCSAPWTKSASGSPFRHAAMLGQSAI